MKIEVFDSDCASFSLALVADLFSGRISGIIHVLLKADLNRMKDYLTENPTPYTRSLVALRLLIVQLRTSTMPDNL